MTTASRNKPMLWIATMLALAIFSPMASFAGAEPDRTCAHAVVACAEVDSWGYTVVCTNPNQYNVRWCWVSWFWSGRGEAAAGGTFKLTFDAESGVNHHEEHTCQIPINGGCSIPQKSWSYEYKGLLCGRDYGEYVVARATVTTANGLVTLHNAKGAYIYYPPC